MPQAMRHEQVTWSEQPTADQIENNRSHMVDDLDEEMAGSRSKPVRVTGLRSMAGSENVGPQA